MTVFTKGVGADRLIIDMGKFAFQLKKARCTTDFMVQFKYKISFDAAKKQWDWVNYNGMRSFVLIADHFLCGKDWSLEPWLVSRVTFNATDLTVKLDAEKRTWKQIAQSYSMDFGNNQFNRGGKHKRLVDFDFDKSFALDLSSEWPSAIFSQSFGAAEFGITCQDCGTTGSLVFAGHIEGSLFGGIDKFMISATPNDISANLNLNISFAGQYRFGDEGKKEFDIITIPLPAGWTIPGVLTFGPNAKVSGGFALESIAGQATIGSGITATIPDDSIAMVDLFAKKKLDVHGWIPEFETKPLEIQAEITASGEVYTKLEVAVTLEVLDEDGVNVDVNLKFPKLRITASGGWNPSGFCPPDPDPFGVSLDIWLGAELALEGYTELDGKRNELFDVDLFVSDEIFHFPVICKSFGDAPPGSCAVDVPADDLEWYENEVTNDGALPSRRRRSLPTPEESVVAAPKDLSRRRSVLEKRAGRTYNLDCDAGKKHTIVLKDYPVPKEIRDDGNTPNPVPLFDPMIKCGDTDSAKCKPQFWNVVEVVTAASIDDLVEGSDRYASEHVYEGDWIKEWLNDLYTKYYKPDNEDAESKAAACKQLADAFSIGQTTGPMEQILNQLGTDTSYTKTMTIFRQKENTLKHRIFKEGAAVVVGEGSTVAQRSCKFGRIVNACKYMMQEKTQQALMATIKGFTIGETAYPGIDGVLTTMDSNANIAKPPKGDDSFKWAAEHKAWLTNLYRQGVEKTRTELFNKAKEIKELAGVDADIKAAMDAIVVGGVVDGGEIDKYCKDTFEWGA